MNLRRPRSSATPAQTREAGAALLVSLMLLLIITLIGLTAARTQTLEVRLSSNMQNRNIALESGEATLREGEGGLLLAMYFGFSKNTNGLYTVDSSVTQAWYQSITWSYSTSSTSNAVMAYGGNAAPSIAGDNSAQNALFIIEQLPAVTVPGESISTQTYGAGVPPASVFRITTQAVGGDTTSTVTLQSLFH